MNPDPRSTPPAAPRAPRTLHTTRRAVVAAMATVLALPALGDAAFVATRPTARVEYWQQREAQIATQLADEAALDAVRVVFIGDSITDFWGLGDNPWVAGQTGGRAVWDATFGDAAGDHRALNLGISGDRTEHVLFRLLPRSAGGLGHLDAARLDPDVIVLMIGINNTWAAEPPVTQSVFEGIRAVVMAVHERKPRARLILQSLLPTNDAAKNHATIEPVNRRLRDLVGTAPYASYVDYLDLYPHFVDASGVQLGADFMDGLHPNEAGYRIWRDALLPALARARAHRAP